jgi:RNA polymerase sigma factor (sigma-70 family)
MSEEFSFRDLILRIRAGEEAAATELVRRYEPVIRRAVRLRLRDPRLRRCLDSMDICQSVLASFFVRAALNQYDLEQPEHLLKLLATMARNKVANQVHKQQAECRDVRRVEARGAELWEVADPAQSPSSLVAARELLQAARSRLSVEERHLLELREQGREWVAIATELGGSPESLRKKLARAVERVVEELGLDEARHE